MKRAALACVFLLPLALAPAFVSAQTDQPAASAAVTPVPPATQDQVQQIQRQQNDQNEQLQKLKGTVQEVKGTQEQQGTTIDDLTNQTKQAATTAETANTNANAAKEAITAATSQLNQKITDADQANQKRMRNIRNWLIGIGLVVTVMLIMPVFREKPMSREEIEQIVSERVVIEIVEKIVMQKVYVNSSVPELRTAWREARLIDRDGDLSLVFVKRFEKDLSKGHDLEGDVEYKIKFDDGKPIEKQVPQYFYGTQRVAHNDIGDHATFILKERKKAEAAAAVAASPKVTVIPSTWETQPNTSSVLHKAIEGTQTHRQVIGK